ncbi:MAG: DUF998 domain-containing protein [Sulfolobaceae archaeon]
MYRTILKSLGIVSLILAWIIILTSIYLNPWFIFTKNAFSDLGSKYANYYYLYNFGLVIVSILGFIYACYLAYISRNKIETIGSAFVMVAMVFLALIGIFPEGTYPHLFVSFWFFTQFAIAILTWGIGIFIEGDGKIGSILILLFIIGVLGSIIIPWPSAATIETWGIIIIDISIILLYIKFNK